MTPTHMPAGRLFSRREILALAAGVGAAAALPATSAFAAAPVLTRAIPRTGERLPVVGLGTAIVFDIGDDAAKRAERRAVIQALLDGGGRLIDTAPSYGTAETVLGPVFPEIRPRARGGDLCHARHRPAGIHAGQSERRAQPAAGCRDAQEDGRFFEFIGLKRSQSAWLMPARG